MTAGIRTEISTAVELIARLYVSAHPRHGDLAATRTEVTPPLPPGDQTVRALSGRYFGDDFALGTNLMPLAVARGWSSSTELLRGVEATSPDDLALSLLASTGLSVADREASAELVAAAVAGERGVRAAARELARLGSFRRAAVEHVLRDPLAAHAEVCALLGAAAAAFGPSEDAASDDLRARASRAESLLAARGREAGLLELTGGWSLRDPEQGVVAVPTLVDIRLVITRLLPDDRLLLVYSGEEETSAVSLTGLAAVAHALGSEQRLAILQLVKQEARSGAQLAELLGLTPATVHHHTSMLRSVGLLTSVRDAHSVLHSLSDNRLDGALAHLRETLLGEDGGALP